MFPVSDDDFDEMVTRAVDAIPERFSDEFENLTFFWEDEPDKDFLEDDYDPELLGIYDGRSLYERGDTYGMVPDMPDCIIVYKGPHVRMCGSLDELQEEVRKTVVHEVGHYFGMDEDDLERMGYL